MLRRYKKINDNYSLIKNKVTNKRNEFLYGLAKEYDNYGFMSNDVGDELNGLFNNPDYIIGIHRTGYSVVNEDYLKDIFYNGLINNCSSMQGACQTDFIDIEQTITLFYDFVIMSGQIKVANNYKNSNGVIIVKIPKSYLGKGTGEIKPIYYKDNENINRLLPEFIYGYVPVKDGNVGDIIHNPNYSDIHNYDNDGLYYEKLLANKIDKIK